nr:reductive dehalogenase [uncultured bacterium]
MTSGRDRMIAVNPQSKKTGVIIVMSKFHSTISRRDFMKGIGLTGAGIGAAALVTPRFSDIDDAVGSPSGQEVKQPWWVKHRDAYNTTVEIDWDLMKPFAADYQGYRFGIKSGSSEAAAMQAALEAKASDVPGSSLKDSALNMGWRVYRSGKWVPSDFFGPQETNFDTPESLGVPKWTGTKEENAKLIRAAYHSYGVPQVAFLELDEKIKSAIFEKGEIRWENCDEPYTDGGQKVVPNSYQYLICMLIRQNEYVTHFGDHTKGYVDGRATLNIGSTTGYSTGNIIGARAIQFLKTLGWGAVGRVDRINVATGGLSGLSELSRNNHNLTPKYGTLVRYVRTVLTDLPLPSNTPIDAGMHRFCKDCAICANHCPFDSIPLEKKPSWEGDPGPNGETNTWNRPGIKTWHMRWAHCHGCPFCDAACVFNQMNDASIHEMIKTFVSVTPVLNGFFATMDKTYGYGDCTKYEEWWDRDLETWPYDCIQCAPTGPGA